MLVLSFFYFTQLLFSSYNAFASETNKKEIVDLEVNENNFEAAQSSIEQLKKIG